MAAKHAFLKTSKQKIRELHLGVSHVVVKCFLMLLLLLFLICEAKKFRPIQHNHPPPTRTTLDQDIMDEMGSPRHGKKSAAAIEKV